MKARIREVELDDATSTEIANVLAQIMSTRTPQLEPPTDERLEQMADEAIEAEVVEPVFGVVPAEEIARAEQITTRLHDALEDTLGEEIPRTSIVYPTPPPWSEIPIERRWWGHGMRTLHLIHPDDATRSMCNRSKKQIGGNRRENDRPPAESIANVCGTCWRRQVDAERPG